MSKLYPFRHQILVRAEDGWTYPQIVEWLAAQGLSATSAGVRQFCRNPARHWDTHPGDPAHDKARHDLKHTPPLWRYGSNRPLPHA